MTSRARSIGDLPYRTAAQRRADNHDSTSDEQQNEGGQNWGGEAGVQRHAQQREHEVRPTRYEDPDPAEGHRVKRADGGGPDQLAKRACLLGSGNPRHQFGDVGSNL